MIDVEVLVVGGGPAGVAAALHARLLGLDVLLISDEPPGGLACAARRIDNLPGLPAITGARLGQRLHRQLERAAVPWRTGRVLQLAPQGSGFVVEHGGGSLRARCAILACGTRPRRVEIEGWPSCLEHGLVHRDVRSLPADLRDQRVLVLGGGEVALDTALSCIDRGARVALALRGAACRARAPLLDEARRARLELWPGTQAHRCAPHRDGVEVALGGAGAPHPQVRVQHVVACIGREPDRALLAGLGLGAMDAADVASAVPGLFLAGDLIRVSGRYIAPAQGDGVRAACLAGQRLRPDIEVTA